MAKQRKDINALSQVELDNYIHALNILRARSAVNFDDVTGYDYQAALHNDNQVGPCEHGNDLFLAWHRCHLHYFEKLLQESDPPRTSDITIPYWDWMHEDPNGKFPRAFSQPGLSMQRSNASALLPADTLEIIIGEKDINKFSGYPKGDLRGDYGRLENGPHNSMHGNYIGGRMANPESAAEDPIYFSFHCFIDLCWAEWQRRYNYPPASSPEADLQGFEIQPMHKAGDFQRTTDLGFEYEYNEMLKLAFAQQIDIPAFSELISEKKLDPLFEGRISGSMQANKNAQFSLPAIENIVAEIKVSNLKVPVTGSYTLEAFVHPKDLLFNADSDSFRSKYYAGYIALWKSHNPSPDHSGNGHGNGQDHDNDHGPRHGGGHRRHQHPTSCTARFNVSKILQRTPVELRDKLVFTLYYLPAPDALGNPQPGADVVKEIELDNVLLEIYQR